MMVYSSSGEVLYGCGKNGTGPTCSKPAGHTAQGLCDMAGNVWEWVEDGYHDNYDGAPTDGSPWLATEGDEHVLRSGSLLSYDPDTVRASFRYRPPAERKHTYGFRCARTHGTAAVTQ